MESLHAIFQPALLAVESRGQQAILAARMSEALLHATTCEFSRVRQPKYLDRELANDILAFMRARRWRGHLSGHGHSKKRPLLTKLVGGMHMWKGEREWREEKQDKAEKAAAGGGATAAEADAVPADTSGTPPLGGNAVVQFVGLDQKDN